MALHVLRNELAPLHTDPDLLHPLSRFVIYSFHYTWQTLIVRHD
jgi:hypothetical protein